MGIEENKEVVRKCIKLWCEGNLDELDEIVDPSMVYINPVFPKEFHGLEEYKEAIKGYRSIFPNSTIEILDEVAENDKIVLYIMLTLRLLISEGF